MSDLKWREDLEIGVPQVDAQHRSLLALVARLEEASRRGRGSRVIRDILSELMRYTVQHFRDEERLMAEYVYPDIEHHVALRAQLVAKLQRLERRLAAGERITRATRDLLAYWVTDHIMDADRKIGVHLQSRFRQAVDAGLD